MKPTLIALSGAALLVVAVVLAFSFNRSGDSATTDTMSELRSELASLRGDLDDSRARQSRLAEEISALKEQQGELESSLGELARRAESSGAGPAGEAGAGIVNAALDAAAAGAPPGEELELDLEEAVAELIAPENRRGRQGIWDAITKAGKLDEAIAMLEDRVAEEPRNPDAHADLGYAYIQKIFESGDLEKARWSMKADGAYDNALALDDQHWGARFSKAVNYSFAPPVFGFQSKAIEQFEILRGQQEAAAPQEHFRETYMYLGNLYDNQGKRAKAVETWRRGLELFPESRELQSRVESAAATSEEQ